MGRSGGGRIKEYFLSQRSKRNSTFFKSWGYSVRILFKFLFSKKGHWQNRSWRYI